MLLPGGAAAFLASYRADEDTGRSGHRLGSRLRPVYLEDVCGDIDGSLVVHALKLQDRVVDSSLKTRDELGRGFRSPAVDEVFAS